MRKLIHSIAVVSALLIMLSFKATSYIVPVKSHHAITFEEEVMLCSGASLLLEARCTGSFPCNACSNCSRCAHCTSGGTCGVCSSGVSKRYSTSSGTRASTTTKHEHSNIVKSTTPKTEPIQEEKHETPAEIPIITISDDNLYTVTQETSLRAAPDSKAKVLRRLSAGEQVKVIEQSTQYWWRVVQNGKTGWVKNFLLEKN